MNYPFKTLATYLKPYRFHLIIGPACKVVEVIFDVITPIVVAHMIDSAVAGAGQDVIIGYGIALVLMTAIGFSFTLVCQKAASLTSQGFGTKLRQALYHKINELSSAEVERFGTASLITRLTSDINQVQLAVALLVRQVIRWPFIALFSMVAALLIDWQLGLFFLVCTPLVAGVFAFVMKKSLPYFRVMQEKLDRVTQVAREGLEGTRVVRAFVREDHERKRFETASFAQADVAVAAGKLSAVLNPATILIMDLGIAAILLRAGGRVDAGELTQGQMVAFVSYMTQVLVSISYVANMVVTFTRASASAQRIADVLSCEPSITNERARALALPLKDSPALAMNGVSFAYPNASGYALENITLCVPRGGTLGVIGGTGSGKSTLASLIPRLYDASEGSVELGGADVRTWELSDLRHTIGFVPQHVALISGTVRSNLAWGSAEELSDEALWSALEVAQAADFVRELPQGLDAPVEADGRNLSGGQRQRLSIARALVGKPRVLVLDDASSALDYATDARLRAALQQLPGLDACVIVSQRVASVRSANLIAVLDHGRLVGLSSHEQLLANCEVYQEICKTQHVEGGER